MKHRIIVEKMISYINKIFEYTNGCSFSDFSENSMLVEACVFNLSQIGELTNRIDEDFKYAHKNIPWHLMYGLRNRIVHDYDGVNLLLIWEIITDDLPKLYQQLVSLNSEF